MRRVYILAEGQTEETFLREVIQPHLWDFEIEVLVTLLITKRGKDGRKFRGGITSYEKLRREVRLLLIDRGAVAVTTMLDFYGLPEDFPGRPQLPRGSCYDRVAYLEDAFRADIGHQRFHPYLSLHEFEALLLVAPEQIGGALPGVSTVELASEAARFQSPEEIDEGPETHPSVRIQRSAPGYVKPVHGPIIARRIGLDAMRRSCPHFDAWLRRLEALG